MSIAYDRYLQGHRANVARAVKWLEENLPDLFLLRENVDVNKIINEHDASKNDPEEYDAYDNYFYGINRSFAVVDYFNKAWLHHIHHNPHHWQHWVLINDDPKLGETCIEMPYQYVMEMICDWWTFGWKNSNLYEIFRWYEDHKDHIKLHPNTRKLVESILKDMQKKLYEGEEFIELEEEENA